MYYIHNMYIYMQNINLCLTLQRMYVCLVQTHGRSITYDSNCITDRAQYVVLTHLSSTSSKVMVVYCPRYRWTRLTFRALALCGILVVTYRLCLLVGVGDSEAENTKKHLILAQLVSEVHRQMQQDSGIAPLHQQLPMLLSGSSLDKAG